MSLVFIVGAVIFAHFGEFVFIGADCGMWWMAFCTIMNKYALFSHETNEKKINQKATEEMMKMKVEDTERGGEGGSAIKPKWKTW